MAEGPLRLGLCGPDFPLRQQLLVPLQLRRSACLVVLLSTDLIYKKNYNFFKTTCVSFRMILTDFFQLHQNYESQIYSKLSPGRRRTLRIYFFETTFTLDFFVNTKIHGINNF